MTHRETSHVNRELFKHEDDLTNIDRGLTRRRKHIAWRRQKIFTLLVQGVTSTYDLASVLHVSQSTASRDVRYLKQQATEELRMHITERLPWQYRICSEGISSVLRYAWSMILEDNTKANKIAALSLIANCYKDLLEISTNASVITSALQEIEKMKNEILMASNDQRKQAVSDSSSRSK